MTLFIAFCVSKFKKEELNLIPVFSNKKKVHLVPLVMSLKNLKKL
jgi:hypothetical protein